MKIAFDSTFHWDFNAPTLDAEIFTGEAGERRFRVWCDHCQVWHYHGPRSGHREAHCHDRTSPYERSGYNLRGPESE
ncbi:hypothetical protein U8335_20365 [Roseiconus lacunae]|uniref:hypothetical protein n=1 Tax=Roseiconus lacunae TaxID=2605694 RepID=UPI003093BA91|nr:hypothetical protein U8335_20365 [Stieleria sp. HD01]